MNKKLSGLIIAGSFSSVLLKVDVMNEYQHSTTEQLVKQFEIGAV